MFALITASTNSRRRNHTDQAAAVLSAKQASSGSRYRQKALKLSTGMRHVLGFELWHNIATTPVTLIGLSDAHGLAGDLSRSFSPAQPIARRGHRALVEPRPARSAR
jgi:hypothetical protein